MNWSLAKSKPYVSASVAILFFFLLLGAISIPAQAIFSENIKQHDYSAYLLVSNTGQLVLSILVVALMARVGVKKAGVFGYKGLGRGMLLGWFGLLFALLLLTVNLVATPSEFFVVPKTIPLLMVLLSAFLTGVFEEVLVRGLALNLMLERLGGSSKGILKAVLFTSLLFGVAHFVNIRTVADIFPVTIQVLSATMIGVYFAALYLRTRTLWVPIIIHAAIDAASFIMLVIVSPEGLLALSQQSQDESAFLGSLLSLLITVPFLVSGLMMLKKHTAEASVPSS